MLSSGEVSNLKLMDILATKWLKDLVVAPLAGLAILVLANQSFAQYRCNENGKAVFTDRPCASQPTAPTLTGSPKMIGDAGNTAYSTTSGAWRGQVQFMAKAGTSVINEAHAVVPFVIDIDPQGKVTGTSNGCSLKGIAAPSIMDTLTNLDVTLTGCGYPGYNRQMTGRLALYKAQKYVDFSIVNYDMQSRPVRYYEIKGTLRR